MTDEQSPSYAVGGTAEISVNESIWIGKIHYECDVVFRVPCCATAVRRALIRRSDRPSIRKWTGVPCSVCDKTYTVEIQEEE